MTSAAYRILNVATDLFVSKMEADPSELALFSVYEQITTVQIARLAGSSDSGIARFYRQ